MTQVQPPTQPRDVLEAVWDEAMRQRRPSTSVGRSPQRSGAPTARRDIADALSDLADHLTAAMAKPAEPAHPAVAREWLAAISLSTIGSGVVKKYDVFGHEEGTMHHLPPVRSLPRAERSVWTLLLVLASVAGIYIGASLNGEGFPIPSVVALYFLGGLGVIAGSVWVWSRSVEREA